MSPDQTVRSKGSSLIRVHIVCNIDHQNIDSRREQMTDIAVNSKKRVQRDKRVPLPPDKCV